MIFREELARAIVKGDKTATRRQVSGNPRSPWALPMPGLERSEWSYPEGKVFTVNPGRGAHRVAECRVTRRYMQRLGDMSEASARKEGFDSLTDFIAAWTKINGSYDVHERVHVVEFELVSVSATPEEIAA
jgi:uncharacterized protein YhfF